MSARFVDRETPMLLPPDMRDWVPEDDLVQFVIEAVHRLPLEVLPPVESLKEDTVAGEN